MDYPSWHQRWDELKAEGRTPSPEAVLEHWKDRVPALGIRRTQLPTSGYRKANAGAPTGEGRIEAAILGRVVPIEGAPRADLKLLARYHCPALARSRSKQVIPDILGVLRFGNRQHPIAVEVKQTADDCWKAVIQCLREVKMLRAKAEWLQVEALPDEFRGNKGIWGMVLAPRRYYEKANSRLPEALRLLDLLHTRKTHARIMLAEWDESKLSIRWRGGYCPT